MNRAIENSLVFTLQTTSILSWGLFMFAIGLHAGDQTGRSRIRAEAVSHGLGGWSLDKTGYTTFRRKVDRTKTTPAIQTGFHNPATAEDYEHMHDYLPQKEKPVK